MKNADEALEGTSQQVQSLTFGGGSAPGQDFYPRITEMVVALPAASQLLGQELNIPATWSRAFVESTSANPPDALLDIAPTPLNFGSAKAGVVAAPTVSVNRIQRVKGPSVEPLPTNPAALFGDDAKLLGVVPLKNIIADLGPPPTITWTGGANPGALMQWKQPVKRSSGPFKPLPGSLIDVTVLSSASKVATHGRVTNFDIVIPSATSQPQDILITLHAGLLKFYVEGGRLPSIEVDITSAELGSYLSFVKKFS